MEVGDIRIKGPALNSVLTSLSAQVKQRTHYTDPDLALFNAWKHTHTNYVKEVTCKVFQHMDGYDRARVRLKRVYQQLFALCDQRWRPQAQKAYTFALAKLQKQYRDYYQQQEAGGFQQ
jgi:hypothetical protein